LGIVHTKQQRRNSTSKKVNCSTQFLELVVTFGGNVWMQAEAKVADETLCPSGAAHPEEEWKKSLLFVLLPLDEHTFWLLGNTIHTT